jgi:hypothetical protein
MRDRHDIDGVRLHSIHDAEGKSLQDEASSASPVARPGLGALANQSEGRVDFADEGLGSLGAALGLPALALDELGLCLGKEPYDARGHAGSSGWTA